MKIRKIENFEIKMDLCQELRSVKLKKQSILLLGSVWRSFPTFSNFMKMYLNIVYNLLKSE